jgi:uncharacterized membrane protein YphA (DoxX/SURF4 family)
MIAKLTSLTPTILTAALAVIFVVAGIINIIGRGTVKTDFARWGFPDGFNIVCGGLELVGGLLIMLGIWGQSARCDCFSAWPLSSSHVARSVEMRLK